MSRNPRTPIYTNIQTLGPRFIWSDLRTSFPLPLTTSRGCIVSFHPSGFFFTDAQPHSLFLVWPFFPSFFIFGFLIVKHDSLPRLSLWFNQNPDGVYTLYCLFCLLINAVLHDLWLKNFIFSHTILIGLYSPFPRKRKK